MGEEKKAERQGFFSPAEGEEERGESQAGECGHLRKGESCQREEELRGRRGETLLWRREGERGGGRGT
eukprot:1582704-Rhodomonas_salina.1